MNSCESTTTVERHASKSSECSLSYCKCSCSTTKSDKTSSICHCEDEPRSAFCEFCGRLKTKLYRTLSRGLQGAKDVFTWKKEAENESSICRVEQQPIYTSHICDMVSQKMQDCKEAFLESYYPNRIALPIGENPSHPKTRKSALETTICRSRLQHSCFIDGTHRKSTSSFHGQVTEEDNGVFLSKSSHKNQAAALGGRISVSGHDFSGMLLKHESTDWRASSGKEMLSSDESGKAHKKSSTQEKKINNSLSQHAVKGKQVSCSLSENLNKSKGQPGHSLRGSTGFSLTTETSEHFKPLHDIRRMVHFRE